MYSVFNFVMTLTFFKNNKKKTVLTSFSVCMCATFSACVRAYECVKASHYSSGFSLSRCTSVRFALPRFMETNTQTVVKYIYKKGGRGGLGDAEGEQERKKMTVVTIISASRLLTEILIISKRSVSN